MLLLFVWGFCYWFFLFVLINLIICFPGKNYFWKCKVKLLLLFFSLLFYFLPLCCNIPLPRIIFHLSIIPCSSPLLFSCRTSPLEQRFFASICTTSLGFFCLQWFHVSFKLLYLFLQNRKHFACVFFTVCTHKWEIYIYLSISYETVLHFSIAKF